MTDTNIYNSMERFLQIINRDKIQLPEKERTRNNTILRNLLHFIIDQMKKTDPLFAELYIDLFYGGSYFDGLKVETPDEYDIDVLFDLPEKLRYSFTDCNKPGSVVIKFPENVKNIRKRNRNVPIYSIRGINTIVNSQHYLSSEKFMIWFHRVLSTSLRSKRSKRFTYELDTGYGTSIEVKIRRNGPAFTIRVKKCDGKFMYVDFVPSFKFGEEYWLPKGFTDNGGFEYSKKSFFIIPKTPKTESPLLSSRYWRVSFQEQEKEIIKSKKTLKPSIKLLKRIRNKYHHICISSYFLKTIGMWQVIEQPDNFWDNSLSYVFMTLLKKYRECLIDNRIKYFWYPQKNLIDNVDVSAVYFLINKMITEIEKNPENGLTVVKYILTKKEYKDFIVDYEELLL